jgi:general secretion pathway protein F
MEAFEYMAVDADGRGRRGVMEGDTQRQIRQKLRDQGLIPLSVAAVPRRRAQAEGARVARSIGGTELALLTRQLATLVVSGSAVEEALAAVSRQCVNRRHKGILLGVRSRIMEGYSLAEGLAQFPRVFPELYRATVAAGERSGHLGEVLGFLADYCERSQDLRRTIGLALLYPVVLCTVALLVTAAMLGYVVPQVVSVFEGTGQELPLLTRLLIETSHFIRHWGLLLIVVIALLLAGARAALRREHVRHRAHELLLRLPLVSRLVRGMNAARFSGTLGILVSSGVPLVNALAIASDVVVNLPMREAAKEAARKVSEGSSLYRALEGTGQFPPVMVEMIASGEASGTLEEMLTRAAANQEKETHTLVMTAVGLFEPLLILAMGVMVLTIVMAILLPIFELNRLVR